MTPDQRQQRADGDGAINAHGQNGSGHVNKQDQNRAPLLVIGRRGETQIQGRAKTKNGGQDCEGQNRARQAHELVRIGVAEQELHLTTQIEADTGRRREGT